MELMKTDEEIIAVLVKLHQLWQEAVGSRSNFQTELNTFRRTKAEKIHLQNVTESRRQTSQSQ